MVGNGNGMAGLRGLPRKVAMVIYPDVLLLDATGPVQVFSSANEEVARRFGGDTVAYQVEMLGPHEGPVKTAAGVLLVADRSFAEARDAFDTVLIAGGSGVLKMIYDTSVTGWVCDISRQCRRIGSVCTGAFLLAAAGLLDGRRATTHWVHLEDFAERFPKVDVEPDAIFVQDGHTYTAAGVSAGMDLALALVEEDWGRDVALAVARRLVLFLKRPGGQSQFSSHLRAQTAERDRISDLQSWILENLAGDLTVAALADRAAMSPRNFARAFLAETGMTPAKYVETARLEAARRRLEDAQPSVDIVAAACGFGNAERMRRAFHRHLRISPSEYRDRFRSPAPQAILQGAAL